MPPNDPDPMFAAFHAGMNSMYDDGPHTAKEAGERLQRVIDDWQAQHPDCKVVYGDSIVPIPWPLGEPSAWMPAPPPPCIRHEASRVYRWLILTIVVAGIMAIACNVKGCDGRAGEQVKGAK